MIFNYQIIFGSSFFFFAKTELIGGDLRRLFFLVRYKMIWNNLKQLLIIFIIGLYRNEIKREPLSSLFIVFYVDSCGSGYIGYIL